MIMIILLETNFFQSKQKQIKYKIKEVSNNLIIISWDLKHHYKLIIHLLLKINYFQFGSLKKLSNNYQARVALAKTPLVPRWFSQNTIFTKRKQSSLENWLISDIGQNSYKSACATDHTGKKEALKNSLGCIKRTQGLPTIQRCNNLNIIRNNNS